MKEFLSDADYNVLSADTGDEAMELCRNYKGAIHLLVADEEMSGASGWDLAQTAARLRPGLVVLFLSQQRMRRADAQHGADGPVDKLLLRVTHALGRKRQQSHRWN